MNEKTAKPPAPQPLRNVEAAPLVPAVAQQRYLEAATADNTRRTYQSAIRQFERWGGRLPALEAQVIRYLLDQAERLNPRTLSLQLTALRQWHRLQGFPDPTDSATVRKTLKGIKRVQGQPKRQAKAFHMAQLEQMIASLAGEGLKTVRDRALLLVGFFGAFRRSELVSLTVEHLAWEPEGVIITLPRSKTDQTGEGQLKALPTGGGPLCPVTALRHWLAVAGIEQGPVFRGITRWGQLKPAGLSPASVNLILKTVATQAGLEGVPALSSHSLRRSLATNAHHAGASFESIKRQGGWSHDGTVWNYIEAAQRFEDNAVAALLTKANQSSL